MSAQGRVGLGLAGGAICCPRIPTGLPSGASGFGANRHLSVLMTSVPLTLSTHSWKLLKSQALSAADQRSFVVGKD